MDGSVTKNAVITSILARCTVEPEFMKAMLVNPRSALSDYDLPDGLFAELSSFKFESILHFAGFITKVKNNPTWNQFFETRKLLKLFDLEHSFFEYYFPHFSFFTGTKPNQTARTSHFCKHLKIFLQHSGSTHADMVCTILRHTELINDLKTLDEPYQIQARGPAVTFKSVPKLLPTVRIQNYPFDPLEILLLIDLASNDALDLVKGDFWMLYQIKRRQISVTAQDHLATLIILKIDGLASISTIFKGIGKQTGIKIPKESFLAFFFSLREEGIIHISEQ